MPSRSSRSRVSSRTGAGRLEAGEPPAAAGGSGRVDYARDIKPLLARHCVSCHGATKPRGGLRLDTAAAARKGGKEGPGLVPGKAEESPLYAAVIGEGSTERMPLNRPPLGPDEIARLRAWIDQGAEAPADEPPSVAVHWAFTPPRRPEVPAIEKPGWARNPIDRFILQRLRQAGLEPSAEADRNTLLRRVSLDLIGLPPSPEERAAFLADSSARRL